MKSEVLTLEIYEGLYHQKTTSISDGVFSKFHFCSGESGPSKSTSGIKKKTGDALDLPPPSKSYHQDEYIIIYIYIHC